MTASDLEKLYYHDRERYLGIFTNSPIHEHLELISEILIILKAMKEDLEDFDKAKEILISYIKAENDPADWRNKNAFEIEYKATKFILNFLSRTQSQIDINRRLEKELRKSGKITDEIKSVKEKLIENEEVAFSNDLRHFLQHYSVPKIMWTEHTSSNPYSRLFTFTLDPKELLKSDCFKAKAKEFIESRTEIEIDKILIDVSNYIFEFYRIYLLLIVTQNEAQFFEYFHAFHCKEEIIKKIRNEDYTYEDKDIMEKTNAYLQQIISQLKKSNDYIDSLSFEFYKLVKYKTV